MKRKWNLFIIKMQTIIRIWKNIILLVSERVLALLNCWLFHLFQTSVKIKACPSLSLEHFLVCFHLVCPSFHQPNVTAPPQPLRVRNLQKARAKWLSSPRQLQMLRSLHSGRQSTKVEVVSDRLKADLETQNSLSHLENIKGTCHCYCGHALKPKVRKTPLTCDGDP